MREYEVCDEGRMIQFTGRALASVSSERPGKTRWIELALYITQAGSYVLAAVGKSTEPGEVDRPWVQVSDEPQGIIERLHLYDEGGARYIPRTSRELLVQAGRSDTAIARAFATERIA